MPYLYSEELDIRDEVRARLGVPGRQHECQIVPTGTAAILCAVHWLKSVGVTHLVVLCPSYFPVFYDCEIMGLPYTRVHMERGLGGWDIPGRGILHHLKRNPIYGDLDNEPGLLHGRLSKRRGPKIHSRLAGTGCLSNCGWMLVSSGIRALPRV